MSTSEELLQASYNRENESEGRDTRPTNAAAGVVARVLWVVVVVVNHTVHGAMQRNNGGRSAAVLVCAAYSWLRARLSIQRRICTAVQLASHHVSLLVGLDSGG